MYDDLISEAGDDKDMMPFYGELLSMLDLTAVVFSTVCRCMAYLRYKYDDNKKIYILVVMINLT